MKWIGRIIGVWCILYGLYTFTFAEFTQGILSTVMFLLGVTSLLNEAKSKELKKFNRVLKGIALFLTIFLLIYTYIL